MTSTLTTPRLHLHWKTWVVPAVFLRDFIYDHKHIWQFRYSPPQPDGTWAAAGFCGEDFGWRTHLSLEVASVTQHSLETTQRNLYRVMTGEGQVINIDFAEAVVMSLDLDLDRDTSIPVLPGNLRNAEELLEVRDPDFWQRTPRERTELKRTVLTLTGEIVMHPEQLREIQDSAPFDCLRPPK